MKTKKIIIVSLLLVICFTAACENNEKKFRAQMLNNMLTFFDESEQLLSKEIVIDKNSANIILNEEGLAEEKIINIEWTRFCLLKTYDKKKNSQGWFLYKVLFNDGSAIAPDLPIMPGVIYVLMF